MDIEAELDGWNLGDRVGAAVLSFCFFIGSQDSAFRHRDHPCLLYGKGTLGTRAFDIVFTGYDLHITRKKLWSDEDGPTIAAEEWLAYVATDPQLRFDLNSKRYSVMLAVPSKYPDPWLEWFEGDIYTKNPDEPILAKMLEIAAALKARVQGDDGEIYRSANFEDIFYDDAPS